VGRVYKGFIMKNELLEILRCPKYGVKLKKDNDKLLDDSMDKDIEYSIVNNYPILIDFENVTDVSLILLRYIGDFDFEKSAYLSL